MGREMEDGPLGERSETRTTSESFIGTLNYNARVRRVRALRYRRPIERPGELSQTFAVS